MQTLALLAACTVQPTSTQQGSGAPTGSADTEGGQARTCMLPPVVAPTTVPYPGYTEIEPSTGLHVTAQAKEMNLAAYRLKVTGKVEHALSLTHEEVRCLPRTQAHVSLECPGFFVDEQTLAGTTLGSVLALAGPIQGAGQVIMRSGDDYRMGLTLAEAQDSQNFLAYEWEGQPLPRSHGFPLRAVIPARAGTSWVKWVTEIQVV